MKFSQDSKKKISKYPFDLEGLKKVLKNMSNDMTDIKKQVVENSAAKKSFRPFKKNPSSASQPPNEISNAESDQDTEDPSPSENELKSEEEVELNGLWDFILPIEEENEAMFVSTRSKPCLDPIVSTPKKKKSVPTKEKIKKSKTV